MVYPPGAEADIDIDHTGGAATPDGRRRATESLSTRFEGPVSLPHGGKGFIVRQLVLAKGGDGDLSVWGEVSAIVDADRLYRASGLFTEAPGIDLAIFPLKKEVGGTLAPGGNAFEREGAAFFGPETLKHENPITLDVRLPSGRWRIAAAPAGGWGAITSADWIRRLAIVVAGALIVLWVGLIGHLVEERRGQFVKLRDREEDLRRLSERLTLALDASKVGVWEVDLVTGKLLWDRRMNELYDYPSGDDVRAIEDWQSRLDPASAEGAIQEFQWAIDHGTPYESKFMLTLPGERARAIRAVGKVYESPSSNRKIIGLNWDITTDVELTKDLTRAKASAEARNIELEAAKERIEYISLHDFPTKLPNRMYLDRTLGEHATRCAASGEGVALLHIDLDRFKHINDTLGHIAGDAMLIHTAAMIRRRLGETSFCARIGGDEFIILCPINGTLEPLAALAQELIDNTRRPIPYDGHECRLGMSIGIASAYGADVDRSRLLVNADIALYRAKKDGGNRFVFFTDALQSADRLRKAPRGQHH